MGGSVHRQPVMINAKVKTTTRQTERRRNCSSSAFRSADSLRDEWTSPPPGLSSGWKDTAEWARHGGTRSQGTRGNIKAQRADTVARRRGATHVDGRLFNGVDEKNNSGGQDWRAVIRADGRQVVRHSQRSLTLNLGRYPTP